uniref:Probable ATP-dependent RNA helicase spindle-E n=1 Tax=Anopheles farauti TaxID=69004 RepID=A0A182QHI4_9DIPT
MLKYDLKTMEDDDDALFDFSKPFQRIVISSGQCDGAVIPGNLIQQKVPVRKHEGTEYAKEYSEAEETRLMEGWVEEPLNKSSASHLEDVDDTPSLAEEDTEHVQRMRATELMEPLFSRFNFTVKPNGLSIYASKENIVQAIRNNPVVVIQGMTGCGKTTQVPQYLLEDAFHRKEWCNIVVTQPRRIAATSIARRVAEERSCDVGSLVGYKVGLKDCQSEDTRLTYVTTGVLLNMIITSKSLSRFTHIILDEVHEREVDMDFLLIIIRRLLATSRHTKVVLMSATIDSSRFAHYFKIPGPTSLLAPQLAVSNYTQHEVVVFYLDDLDKLKIDFSIKYEQPEVHDKMYFVAAKLAMVCDHYFESEEHFSLDYKPSIIMFLPGINEIERMADVLRNLLGDKKRDPKMQTKFTILKLHSMLPAEEQALVFRKPPFGHRKVILSTNIAESSVTIPDVKFAIDFCLHRVMVADTAKNFTTLRTCWASRDNCIQRAGRVGRVMNGRVYRLVSRHFYEHKMAQSVEPEMVRCPLGSVVLKTKRLDMGAPHTILALALTPPNLSDISNTLLQLKELGALLRTVNGVYDLRDGDLTYLGQLMGQLPLDLHLAKLVILGYVFSVLEEAIILAAGMSVKNVFSSLRSIEALRCKRHFAAGTGSDGIAILNAYTLWRSVKEQGTGGDTVAWCQRYMLELKSLTEMEELVQELTVRLMRANIQSARCAAGWTTSEKTLVLKVIMAGAFYPYYFIPAITTDREMGDRKVYMEIGGRDPFRTVFFTGFDHANYIGPLYRRQIRALLTDRKPDPEKHSLMKVEFDRSTNRVFVCFEYAPDRLCTDQASQAEARNMLDRIHPSVFEAIKLRNLRRGQSELMVMHHEEAIAFATSKRLGEWRDSEWHPRRVEIPNVHLSVVPPIHCTRLVAIVTHVDHPNKFFLRPTDDTNKHVYERIDQQLSRCAAKLRPFPADHRFRVREIVAAPVPNTADRKWGRAKLLKQRTIRGLEHWVVHLLDYGCTATLAVTELRQLQGTPLESLTQIPERVFEASLAEVQPSVVVSPNEIWLVEAIEQFRDEVLGKQVHVEVYSVVNRVAIVFLFRAENDPIERSVNRWLVASNQAQPAVESFPSKMNHEQRQRVQLDMQMDDMYRAQIMADCSEQARFYEVDDEMDPDGADWELPGELLKVRLTLHGPYSPLEVRCSSTVFASYQKPVGIEKESINSILLDANPQNTYAKLLVAGDVNEMGSNRLVARLTTTMPNIPGMPALMALIFAPTCQLKKDADGTRVVGLLAGLGLDPGTGESIYPEHDMSLAVDVTLGGEDIADINALRYTMDSILHGGHNEQTPLLGEHSIESLMRKVKDYLLKILQRERAIAENDSNTWHDFNWKEETSMAGSSSSGGKKQHNNSSINIYTKAIFPLYDNLNLLPMPPDRMEYLQRHCAELHALSQTRISLPKGGIKCQLCNVALESVHALRIHCCSKLHRDLELKINYRR